jgi:hypothetical protein
MREGLNTLTGSAKVRVKATLDGVAIGNEGKE